MRTQKEKAMKYDKEVILAALALLEVVVISIREVVLAIIQKEEQ